DVPAMQKDQVFQSACNEKLSCSQEPQITCAEETSSAAMWQLTIKDGGGFFRPVPISMGHTWAAQPDLSNFAILTFLESIEIHNSKLLLCMYRSASHENSR